MKNLFFGTNLKVTRGGRCLAKNLEFKIESGGMLLLNGENGSGKSTLLRIMAGLSKPTSGKIYWNNDDVHDNLSEHFERIIYVGHSTAIKSNLTIKENLKYWQKIHLGDKDKRGHLEHSLEIFNLTNFFKFTCTIFIFWSKPEVSPSEANVETRFTMVT